MDVAKSVSLPQYSVQGQGSSSSWGSAVPAVGGFAFTEAHVWYLRSGEITKLRFTLRALLLCGLLLTNKGAPTLVRWQACHIRRNKASMNYLIC